MAGTDVSTSIRSSTTAWRNAWTSNAGMMTTVPPSMWVIRSWLLQPVTWNIGTEIRLRIGVSSGKPMTRRHVSQLARKFS